MEKLGVSLSEPRNPWTDRHKILHVWLRQRCDPACQNSNRSPQWGRPGIWEKYHSRVIFTLFRSSVLPSRKERCDIIICTCFFFYFLIPIHFCAPHSGVDPSVFWVFEHPHNFGRWCSPISEHPQIFPQNMRFLQANGVHLQSIYLLTWRLKQCLLLFTV